MKNIGLVLEGGGMRGLFTAGVLDLFLDKNIEFKYIVGVSAGSCNAVSYISKQYQRNLRINTHYLKDKRYFSLKNLFKTGSLFGMDMIFNVIPNQLDPLDFNAFNNSDCKMISISTNCETGKAEYHEIKDIKNDLLPIQATMSLPLISQIVEYEGKFLLDGGIVNPIPIKKSIDDGNFKNVIVLTQDINYIKPPIKNISFIKRSYKKFPNLINAIEKRHIIYNQTTKFIKDLEAHEKAFVIRPEFPLNVKRLERNKSKLEALYKQGYEQALSQLESLNKFLNN